MFYVYILQSLKINKYYIGSCEDIDKRLLKHNNGFVRSTKNGIPWKTIYVEEFETLSNARRREKQIKLWKSRKSIERLINKK